MRGCQAFCGAVVLSICAFALAAPPTYDKIVVVIEENHSFSQVIGSPNAPYINSLASGGSSLTNIFGITHPSQPNYLHLYSGASQGVTDNSVPPGTPFTTSNLGASLLNGGRTFVGYSESMPSEGYNGATFTTVVGQNQYMRKHNPWANWQSATPSGNEVPTSVNQPFTSFPGDFSTLPHVSMVVPNQQNDMHDGSIAQGDTWLQSNLGGYATWAKANNSLLVVTFDEDESASRNRIPTIFYGANVQVGLNNSTWTLHNLLRTLEDMNGVSHSGAAAQVKPIVGSFVNDGAITIRSYQQGVNGYTSAKDTYIDSTVGSTNFNHGADAQVIVDGSPNQQGLIRFDNLVGNGATQVGTGTKIHSAKLRILTGNATNDLSNNDFGLHTMLRSWTDTDTYDSLVGGVSTDGTEASSTPTFTTLPNKLDVYVVFDVTDTVQAWVDGTLANNGWLLKDLTGTDGWRFISSDNATIGDRPYLEITVPEPAASAGLLLLVVTAFSRRTRPPARRLRAGFSRA